MLTDVGLRPLCFLSCAVCTGEDLRLAMICLTHHFDLDELTWSERLLMIQTLSATMLGELQQPSPIKQAISTS